jgi:hypothetical protein
MSDKPPPPEPAGTVRGSDTPQPGRASLDAKPVSGGERTDAARAEVAGPKSAQAGRPEVSVRANREKGIAASGELKAQLESKGHGIRSEVTVKGGAGGSRVDLAPDGKAARTIGRTIESKHVDLDRYRTPAGELDVDKLTRQVKEHVGQVLKHENALREGQKADLPTREALVYTVEHAKPGEAQRVQQILRETATGSGVKGGVLQMENGLLKTASGVALRELGVRPAAGGALMMMINPEFVDELLNAATGRDLEARAKHSDVLHMTAQQRTQLRHERTERASRADFDRAVKEVMAADGVSQEEADRRVREHRAQVSAETAELQKQNPGTSYITESTYVPPPPSGNPLVRMWQRLTGH